MKGNKLNDSAANEMELLVLTVKEMQRKDVSGSQGTWKQFLARSIDKNNASRTPEKSPTSLGGPMDPSKRPKHVLEQFLTTLDSEENKNLVESIKSWYHSKKKEEAQFVANYPPSSKLRELISRTRKHPKYAMGYSFPSYQEGWVFVPSKPSTTGEESLIAIDCEMCQCEDMERQVIKLSVVNSKKEVLLNTLVKPNKPVLNYVTLVTGIGPQDLEDVTFSQKEAQDAVIDFLNDGPVLVGHALYNDLKSLKIDYRKVIDTSFIFVYDELSDAIPSLNHLSQLILGRGLREEGAVHCSVSDATAPIELVEYEVNNGPTPPLKPPELKVDTAELCKLFIHKVPRAAKPELLQELFAKEFSVCVQMLTWKRTTGGTGTTFAVFETPELCDSAFDALPGTLGKDSFGRAQKEVPLPFSMKECVIVRKMSGHGGLVFGASGRKGAVVTPTKPAAPLVSTAGEDLIQAGVGAAGAKRGRDEGAGEVDQAGNAVGEGVAAVRQKAAGVAPVEGKLSKKERRDKMREEKRRKVAEGGGKPEDAAVGAVRGSSGNETSSVKEEVEGLKRQLAAKSEEVEALQKLVTELLVKKR